MKSSSKKSLLAVGITGGIGTGKTEVCNIFASLGARIIYADEVAKRLIETNPTIRKNIERQFGTTLFLQDGSFDRKQMAKLVFNDDSARETLNAIVHPFTLKKINEEIEEAKTTKRSPLLMVEAALLYEAKGDRMFDYMIVVDAEEERQVERVMKRDESSKDEVLKRIRSQMPNKEKAEKADFVIQNNGTRATLEQSCAFLFSLLTKISATDISENE
jgi:dephospho-CoA kinase